MAVKNCNPARLLIRIVRHAPIALCHSALSLQLRKPASIPVGYTAQTELFSLGHIWSRQHVLALLWQEIICFKLEPIPECLPDVWGVHRKKIWGKKRKKKRDRKLYLCLGGIIIIISYRLKLPFSDKFSQKYSDHKGFHCVQLIFIS